MMTRKTLPADLQDMVALVRLEPDNTWSVEWAREALEVDTRIRSVTANGAKAYVERELSNTTRLRWQQMGYNWVAFRRSR